MAEIRIIVTAQDNTQDVFRAIGEGAKSAFDSIGSVCQAIAGLDAETAKQRVIGIDTSKAVSDVLSLKDLIQSLSGSPEKSAPVTSGQGADYAPGPCYPGGSDTGSDTGYATGTNYVPRTGFYKLHQGEAVIPASENRLSPSSSPAGASARSQFSLTIAPGAIVINGANRTPEELARLIAQPMQKELERLGFIAGKRS